MTVEFSKCRTHSPAGQAGNGVLNADFGIKIMKPSEASRLYFERAADLIDMDPSVRKMLLMPKREVQVQIPVEMDNGDSRRSSAIACSTTTHAGR